MSDIAIRNRSTKKRKAKALYFTTPYSPHKIAALSGSSEEEVQGWIFGSGMRHHTEDTECWFYAKEIKGVTVVGSELFREVEPILIASSKAATLNTLTDQLDKMNEKYREEGHDEMSIDELKKLVDIFSGIDKIDRLEQGRATSITETKLDRMDAAEIVAERRRTSSYIIDVDYEEVEE